jgi:O-antigen/teichoic acid export membrane protein
VTEDEVSSGRGTGSRDWVPASHGTQTGDLQKRFTRGLTWTVVDGWGGQLVALATFLVLTHLLGQVDFGLVALAMVFVTFTQLFVDQGMGDALIQRKVLTRTSIDTAFWVAIVTGALLTGVGILLSGPLSELVNEPRLAPIIGVLSIMFLITPLNSIQAALLQREMAFRSLAIRRVTCGVIAGLVGVTSAYVGLGAWALVVQQLTYDVVSAVMLWTASPWRPGLSVSLAEFRSLFGFGINVIGGDVMNWLSRSSDNLMVGTFLGAGPLGLYTIGYRVLDTSQNLLANTALRLVYPTFSSLQADADRLRRAYSRINRGLSVIILPGYIGLALVAQEAVPVLFGQQWVASGPVATTLFLVGPSLSLQVLSVALLYANGRPNIALRFRLLTTAVHVVGFFIAAVVFQSIVAVAAAFVIGSYLLLPVNLYLVRRYAGISIAGHIMDVRWPALATLIMAGAVLAVKFALLGNVHPSVLLVAEILTGFVTFELALFILERSLFIEVLTVALQALPGGVRVGRLLHLSSSPHPRPMGGHDRRLVADETQAAAEIARAEDMLGLAGDQFVTDPTLHHGVDP